jgi:hypothetical protein
MKLRIVILAALSTVAVAVPIPQEEENRPSGVLGGVYNQVLKVTKCE